MMRVHRDIETAMTGLDLTGLWKPGSDRSSSEMYLYPHINSRCQQKTNLLSQVEGGIPPRIPGGRRDPANGGGIPAIPPGIPGEIGGIPPESCLPFYLGTH